MEAATIPQPEVQENDKVEFVSQDQNLRLVIESADTKIDANLRRYSVPGKDVQFTPGPDGLGHVQVDPDDSGVLSFLREHDRFNHDLADGGFYEQGQEPGRPSDSKGILKVIAQAVADGDREALEEVFVAERASESRKEVLDAAAVGLEVIGSDLPAPNPTPVHELGYVRHPSVQIQPGTATEAQLRGEVDSQGAVIADPGAPPVPADQVTVAEDPAASQGESPQVSGPEAETVAQDANPEAPAEG